MKTYFLLALILICAPSFANKVLIIESYHSEYPWDKDYVAGIKETLAPSYQVDTFQMNTKRLPEKEFAAMAEKAYLKYLKIKPDVVVLGDDNALKYMLPKLYNEPISIVFLGINSNPRKLLSRNQGKAKITGVLEQPLLIKSINEIGQLLPEKNAKLLVLFDSGITSKIAKKFISKQYQAVRRTLSIQVDIENVESLSDWQSHVNDSSNSGYSAIVVGLYHTIVDENNQNVDSASIMTWTNQHSPVPLFGFWDFSVGKGKALGGVVLFGKSQGVEAGKMVNKILQGQDTDQIPIHIGKQGKAIYSEFEMERWGLHPPSHWQALVEDK